MTPRACRRGVGLGIKVPACLILVATTSWAVATLISPWLVPLYLGLIGLILCPSPEATRRPTGSGRTVSTDPADRAANRASARVGGDDAGLASDEAADRSTDQGADQADPLLAEGQPSTAAADAGPGAPASTATARPKRARGRPRKAIRPTTEPTEVAPATWVEVGPGKFVRVESPAPPDPIAGPHLLVEPTTDPSLADPGNADAIAIAAATGAWEEPASSPWGFERGAIPGLDFNPRFAEIRPAAWPDPASCPPGVADEPIVATLDRADDSPAAFADEPSRSPVVAATGATFAPELDFQAHTVDGIAPQVDGPDEVVQELEYASVATTTMPEPDPVGPDCGPAAEEEGQRCLAPLDPRDEPEAPVEIASIDPSYRPTFRSGSGFEPAADLDPAPLVAGQAGDDPSAPPEVAEEADAAPGFATDVQGDLEAASSPPRSSARGCPVRRVRRLVRVIRPGRGGTDRHAGRDVHDGRPHRPARSSRRPIGPGRPSGRRDGRPRQIIRALPPRAPPTSDVGWATTQRRDRYWLSRKAPLKAAAHRIGFPPGNSLQAAPGIGSTGKSHRSHLRRSIAHHPRGTP